MEQSELRQPGLQVVVNGTSLSGVYEAEVNSNAYLGADRFCFRSAFAADDPSLWTSLPIQIDVRLGINDQWQSLITGQADTLQIDPIRGDIQIAGRDNTALFIGAQTHESYENHTASDVVNLLASRRGLSASVTATTDLIGRYYQNGHTRIAPSQHGRSTTEWDVLSFLALHEGFDVWVSGNVLNFQPPSPLGTMTVAPGACISMRLERDLTIAAGFEVQVMSWDCAQQQAVTGTAVYGNISVNSAKIATLRPNLSSAAAQQLANRIATQLSQHERVVSLELPADIITTPRMQIALSATNTDFDGMYRIYEVERRFSIRHGFTQHILARQASWTIS